MGINAQTGTIQIGSGTATNTTMPINSYFGYNYTQQIITKAEYNVAQGTAGNITKIRFYCTSLGSSTTAWNDWRIYIGHTSKSSFSSTSDWVPAASLTQVYDGTFTPVANSWIEFTLTTPFAYNNTDNIVIGVYEKAALYTSSASRATFNSYTSASNTGLYLSNDTSTNVNPATPGSGTRTGTLAQIQFTGAISQNPYTVATTLSGFGNVCINNTSAAGSFTLTGGNLTGDVTVGALTGYTYSTASAGPYTSTLALSPVSGSLSQQVYVKLSPTVTTSGAYNGNIPITGGGTTSTTNVAATGAGINTAPSLSSNGALGALSSNQVTITGSTISSLGCSNITAYGLEYSTATFTGGTGTQVAGTGFSGVAGGTFSTTIAGLTPNTTYYLRAYATNNGGTTYYSVSTFITGQTPATLPYTEDFEGAVTYNLLNASYTNKWMVGSAVNNGGSKSLYITNDGTANTYTLNSSATVQAYRDIAIPAGTGVTQLSFNWKGVGETASLDYLRAWLVPVTYVPTPGTQISSSGTRIQLGGNFNLQSTWQTYTNNTLNLSAFAGSTVRLVFEWYNDSSGGTNPPAAVDNVSLIIPQCLTPLALTATSTINNATISWTAPTIVPANGYEYYYSTTNTAPVTPTGSVAAGVLSVPLSSLTANTTYYFWVRSVCDATTKSDWSGPATFRTDCNAVTVFPFNETFESAAASTTPDCWTVIDANADGDKWTTVNDATYAHGGTKSVTLYTDFNSGANNDWLITPAITLAGNQRLRYWVRARSASEPNDYTVKLSTTGRAPADFTTTLQTLTTVANTAYQEVIIDLSAYSGTTYIAFHVPPGGLDGYYIYIDDVTVENRPACNAPAVSAATNITETTATIGWTALATTPANGYEYYVSSTNTAPVAATTPTNTTTGNSVNLTSLTASTSYYWWVRSACAGTEKSEWAAGGSFYTGYCITTPGTVNATDIVTNVAITPTYGAAYTNSSSNSSTNYTSYSNTPVVLYRGIANNTVAITFGTDGTQYSAAWIDYNQNLIFDADEAIGVATTAAAGSATATYTFTVPAGATLGNTKLRVRGGSDSAYTASGACTQSSYGETEDYIVTIANAPTCFIPTAVAVTTTSVTHNGAAVTWTAPAQGTATSYQYEVRTTGTPGTAGAVFTDSTVSTGTTLTNLTQGTQYTVYVRTFCGGTDYSAWTTGTTFSTHMLTPVTWTEPFATTTLPTGWVNSSTAAWTIGNASTSIGAGNGNYIYRALNNTNTTSSFTTINVGLLTADNRLKFDYKVALNNGDPAAADTGNFVVEISTNYGNTWTTLETVANSSLTGWHTKFYPLASYTGQVVKIRVTGNRLTSNPNYAFDNFVIEPTPGCEPPTVLTATTTGSTTATIGWTASTSAPAGGYEYYYATTNTAPTAATTTPYNVVAGTVTASLTTLLPNTQYYVWVRSVCDESNKSPWSASSTFTTYKSEPSNYATAFAVSTATTTDINFTWTAAVAGTQAPDGYVLTGSTTNPAATPADGTDAANATLATASPIRKYTGATTATGTLTAGTAGTMYYFKNVTYTNSGTNIDFKTDGTIPALNYATKPAVAATITATAATPTALTLNWTLPASFDAARHQVLVFVKQGTSTTVGTPTQAATTYSASTVFTAPGTAYQGDAAAYNVYNGDGTSVNLTGLTMGISYNVSVFIVMEAANYNSSYTYSNAASSTVTTAIVVPVIWTEGFTSATTPAGWNIASSSFSVNNSRSSIGTDTYYIQKNLYSSSTATGTFTTVNVGPLGNDDRLVFKYKAANYDSPYTPPSVDSGSYVVQLSTNYGSTWTTLETVNNNGVAGWQNKTYPLAAYSGQTVQVRITANWISGDYDLAFDNFKIDPSPSCGTPISLVASNLTTTSATLNWSAPAQAPSAGYDYYYTSSATAPTSTTTPSGSVAAGVLTKSISALTQNTTYYFWIRSNCGTEYGEWTNTSFYTGFCTPSSDDYYDYISNFSTTGGTTNISNTSTSSGTGYSNFSAQSVTGSQGSTINFTATMQSSTYGVAIWVDWNNDLSFSTSERVYVSGLYLSTVSGSFAIPVNAILGNHRMRIMADYGSSSPSNPCAVTYDYYDDGYYGEIEDYTLNVTVPCFNWNGSFNTSWTNTANWCGGVVPTATSDVVIPSTANNPVISTGTALAHNLTVGAGATLTVATGATLSVDNILSVNPAGTLTIANNGALLQGAATATNDNAGKITIHKSSNPLYRLDYTMWSSPVAAQNLLTFSPATSATRFYEYKYASNGTAMIEGYWSVTPGDHSFEAAKGYLIRMPNADTHTGFNEGTASFAFDGIFTGTPNNGNVSIALSTDNNRFTAVGNPYPSPISVADFFTANSGKLHTSTGLYLWRKRNSAASSSYATLTQAGYTANPGDATTVSLGNFYQGANATAGNWVISQGQGFIVKTATGQTNPQLNFTNSMRRAAPGATQGFFRTAQSTASKLWLNMKAQNGTASQALIAYMEEGTTGLDYGYDGLKLTDANTVSLYSLAENAQLAIQARPEFDATDVVPMGFTVPAAGEFTVGLDHTEGVFEQGQVIYLKDNAEGIIRNISDRDYTFTSEAGTFEGRFEVVYLTSALGTDNPTVDPDTVIVYKQGNTISINTGSTLINGVTIFDIRGRQLYSANGINDTKAAVNNLNIAQQVIIVEVNTVKGKVSKRIVY
ncbi:fibronectin type III domain-containing protein [Flavobacterium psychrotrophum]|uniref:fibronectin type III domain-containing protein n=1 Tax=Flavobacterium psychrotrophum TaxID=2294119 RepID=UPI0013C403EB|nr:fibronectin type III domain-containing protein [Flavobacterium psychrotrophum]